MCVMCKYVCTQVYEDLGAAVLSNAYEGHNIYHLT